MSVRRFSAASWARSDAVSCDQRALLERLADHAHQVGTLERLGDEVVGALLHGLDGVLDGAVGGHEHGLGLGRHALARLEQVHAGHARHHEVGEQHRHRLAPDDVERLAARAAVRTRKRLALEDLLEGVDDGRARRRRPGRWGCPQVPASGGSPKGFCLQLRVPSTRSQLRKLRNQLNSLAPTLRQFGPSGHP